VAATFFDDDADLSLVQRRNVAVLGYGPEEAAHALSLRDSGVDVRVGLPPASPGIPEAEAEGVRVVEPYEACEEADLVVLFGADATVLPLFADVVQPNLVAGDALFFAHGFGVRFGGIDPPSAVDVCLVAACASGDRLREEYSNGRGVPVLVAVERDASGEAWDLALSYARAIGGTRAGATRTTFAEHAEAERFVLEELLPSAGALLGAGRSALLDAGVQPEVVEAMLAGDRSAAELDLSSSSSVVDDALTSVLAERLDRIRSSRGDE
jgi:ketol-acid reductoisomerase